MQHAKLLQLWQALPSLFSSHARSQRSPTVSVHAGAGHIDLFLRRPGEVSEAPILCLDTLALSQSRLSATHPSRPEFVCAGKPGSEMGKSRDKLG